MALAAVPGERRMAWKVGAAFEAFAKHVTLGLRLHMRGKK